jgi:HK97 family phage major capsid protein
MPVVPATYDEKAGSIRATLITEDPTEVFDWERWDVVTEVLLISGMTLPEGRAQVPLLDSHMRGSVENQLGSVRDIAPEGNTLGGTVFFASTDDSQKAKTKAAEGHLTDLSAGYLPVESYWVPEGQKQVIAGREYVGPLKVVTRSILMEVSVTPIGAGNRATFRSASDGDIDGMITRRVKEILSAQEVQSQTKRGAKMDENKDVATPSAEEVRSAATVAERARVSEINAIATRQGEGIANISELAEKAVSDGTLPGAFWNEVRGLMKKPEPVAAVILADEPTYRVNDVAPAWKRRAVSMLQVMTARAMGSDRLQQAQERYRDLVKSFGERSVHEEMRQAIEIVKAAKLPRMQEERTLSIVGGGSTGEYLLPAPFLAELFVIIEQYGNARKFFRSVPMGSKTLDLSTVSTKPTAAWATEASNTAASDAAFGTGTLTAGKLVGVTSWSSELEEDSAIGLIPVLLQLMGEAIYTKEDLAGFKGDGTAPFGSFTGMLNAATAAVTMATGKTGFTDATADDFKSVRDALTLAKRAGAKWFLHPDILSHVEGLKDIQNNYIYRNPGGDRPATLWGYPIANGEGIEAMPALSDTAAATRFVAFGNPQWMIMGNRRGLEVMVSREGILSTTTSVNFNSLQADGAILRVSERIAFLAPLGGAFAYLKTATT